MVHSGSDPQEALMALVPEAYRNHPDLMKHYPEVVDFYEYYEGLQEGWDGPALLVFSDGQKVGCRLDRNGLRPARFWKVGRQAGGTVCVSVVGGWLRGLCGGAKCTPLVCTRRSTGRDPPPCAPLPVSADPPRA